LNKAHLDITSAPITAQQLSIILQRIEDNTLSGKTAKQVFEAVWAGQGEPDAVIESKGLRQLTDPSAIETLVNEAIRSNPEQVQQFRDGNQKVLGFFVGYIMKASQGKANPKQVNELLRTALGSS